MSRKHISIQVITLFPEFIQSYTQFGIIAKAIKNKLLKFVPVNLRNFSFDARGTVDDRPYGGGVGMVLRADVLCRAIELTRKSKVKSPSNFAKATSDKKSKVRTILLTPSGKPFKQKDAIRLSKYDELIFVSGRYEGYDERITKFVDEEISIGDYVLMGGELPALVITEAIIRLIPGIIGKIESTEYESFSQLSLNHGRDLKGALLEYPQYTKPEEWVVKSKVNPPAGGQKSKVLSVPRVLLTGNHRKIAEWRHAEAVKRTKKRRPDLLRN